MKSKLLWLFIMCLMFSTSSILAQTIKNEPQKVLAVGTLDYRYVPSIAEQIRTGTFIPAEKPTEEEINPRLRHGAAVIIGKGSTGRDGLADKQLAATQVQTRGSGLTFFSTTSSAGAPSDPTGAVGRDFYIAAWNTSFRIFNKDGTPAMAAASNATVFGSTIGDPIVFYDSAVDRYVLTQFANSPNGFEVAVSQTNDPINDGWHVYSSSTFSTGAFPDYTKFAVWSDAYYITANINGGTGQVFAIERNEMINGNPSTIQAFNLPGLAAPIGGFYGPQVLSVTNDDLPAPGGATFMYQQDDAYAGVAPGNDHFKLWTLDIDWVTPANSLMSAATEYPIAAFNGVFDGGSFSNLTQPTGGNDIDALQALIGNQPQFRKFPTYNAGVFSFVVDVGGAEQAAIRWVEIRQSGDNQPWTIHQEGTYVAPDGRHAWNASLNIDIQGNIGMGYTTMGGTTNTLITSAYTGQLVASSGTGVMDVAEQFIFTSTAGNTSNRYADYSHLTVDPTDDKGFWFVNEVFSPSRSNVVGVFQLAPDTADDVGIISVDTPTSGALTNAETVTVTVFNYGDNAASGFDVTYQVDGGTTITEAFAGSLASGASAQHVFATTADLSTEGNTYSIMACTTLGIDEDTSNDCITQNVTHEFANDIGVTAITAPVSGEGLGNEVVSITIENFGTAAQSGFDVNYIVDGGTPVVETVAATVNPGATISYDFTATVDLSNPATYAISSSTLLAGDSVPGNDTANTSVTNSECATTSSTDTPIAVGPNGGTVTTSVINIADDFVVDDVNVSIDISHTWVGDLDITLLHPDGITSVELMPNNTCGNCDDMIVTFDDAAATSITSATPPISGTFSPANGSLSTFNGLMTAGDWTLTITDNANGDGGQLNGWDLQLCGDMNLSIDDNTLNADLVVIHLGDNMYSIQLPTSTINDKLEMTIYNMLGQTVYRRILENSSGNGYEHELNMQYAASGIYIIRLGTRTAGTYKRIIVE